MVNAAISLRFTKDWSFLAARLMKKLLLLFVLFSFFVISFFGQSVDELLNLTEEISNLDYASSLSSISGITDFSGSLDGMFSIPKSVGATATVTLEISKSLQMMASISNERTSMYFNFDPSKYDQNSSSILFDHIKSETKLKMEVVNLFFDAMLNERKISQLSSEGTSLKNEVEVSLASSKYTYDLDTINTLLKANIKALDFPALNVPDIPKKYIPYLNMKSKGSASDLSFGLGVDFSTQLEFKASLGYEWKPRTEKKSENILGVEKARYFNDMQVLSKFVKKYDDEISRLFKTYSKIYGDYLDGKASIKDVKSISAKISSLGYERDLYCIRLWEEWYFYKVLGERL